MILRNTRRGAVFDVAQRFDKKLCSHDHEAVKELARGLKFADLGLFPVDHVPRVHIVREVHGGHTCGFVPVEDCPLDRRGTAVFGQKRTVYVDGAVFRQGEDIVRQDAPIGHDDQNVRLQLLQDRKHSPVPHFLRLVDRQTMAEGELLHGRKAHLHAAALRLVRLGEDARDLILLFDQLIE